MSELGEFGTLGFSSDDPTEFFGSNGEAYIDEDGMLHGVPPFEALSSGVVLCPSPIYEECFYVYSTLRWGDFVRAVESDLQERTEGTGKPLDRKVRERAERLVGDPPCRALVDGGLICVPEAIFEACGMKTNERLHVIGNSGYFEVWRKEAFDDAVPSINLLEILLGER